MYKIIFISGLFLLIIATASAQQKQTNAAIDLIKSVSMKYLKAKNLAFNVKYAVEATDHPGTVIDSIDGKFLLNGAQFWYQLDSTEVVSDEHLTLTLFHEDHLMYVQSKLPASPVTATFHYLDSLLTLDSDIGVSMNRMRGHQIVKVMFPARYDYRFIEYDIDDASGMLRSLTTELKSILMYDVAVRPSVEDIDNYVQLKIRFTNYHDAASDAKLLDLKNYIVKKDNQFSPFPPFESYQIFLANPDL